ncbi:Methyltransferase [Acidithiobacillus ferrivorans]|uniref:Methyltransferase n=1 Tax=Acidithiobacillus ferrivorans TaxID=160808 RepID=A0A060UMF7_9PROT|nr:16S rRNA (guanine(966)-N(2))-methyltransferase RsmD [Acidithiobacillus ferrivorans]MBN6739583.1 16S rRNA (guanine(966)-N(2))-methyltransferase RsmD [Acidithiobacillus sp. MC6.1]CDQ09650.1 putative SAM-dependent methyltransferase [Acidithiobacillus ferrivorans]SMH67104.1 Methyltransferase [Acidithiobacillus ferrivorans]
MSVSIIAGRHRGRRLLTPAGRSLRPTPGAVRETLFNWLGGQVAGARVLDLFAGSGALGLEAWSRGAREVVFVEKDPQHRQLLSRNLAACGVVAQQLAGTDAWGYLQHCPRSFDIIFADPPFDQGWPTRMAPILWNGQQLAAEGWLYLETSAAEQWDDAAIPNHWRAYRRGRCGDSHHTLYTILPEPPHD